jgi:hypothetical protein
MASYILNMFDKERRINFCRSMPIRRTQFNSVSNSGVRSETLATSQKEYPDDPSDELIECVREELVGEFARVFDQSAGLRCMDGPEMIISLKDDAVPY